MIDRHVKSKHPEKWDEYNQEMLPGEDTGVSDVLKAEFAGEQEADNTDETEVLGAQDAPRPQTDKPVIPIALVARELRVLRDKTPMVVKVLAHKEGDFLIVDEVIDSR